ncbi:MAG: YlxM family DNA-binding protein [Eubacteriales bacterium]
MKHDAVTMTLLFDFYGQLLTEKQASCFDLYYNQDFSLGEIAEEVGISRQAVHDSLARAEQALTHFESTVGFLARTQEIQTALSTISQAAVVLTEKADDETKSLARSILDAVDMIKE